MSAAHDTEIALPAIRVRVEQAQPATVTQHTCLAVLGVPPRSFLRELLPAYRANGGQVGQRGKLRIVDRVAFSRWLLEDSAPTSKTAAHDPVADAAAELGLRLVGGSR